MRPLERFHRYHIDTAEAPPRAGQPGRFAVRIRKLPFLRMAASIVAGSRSLGELKAHFASRPCIYGVYDRPFGGLQAQEHLCRGCMRCMVEHPDVARIEINPRFKALGDGYVKPEQVLTIWNEAHTGRIPVRGMGYGGPFKGPGFDGIWTDMSEIVRPTRDGIHGREYISTAVDLGAPPADLAAVAAGTAVWRLVTLPLPIVLEALPARASGRGALAAIAAAAARTGTLAVVEAGDVDAALLPFAASVVPRGETRALAAAVRPETPMVEWVPREGEPPPAIESLGGGPELVLCARLEMRPGFEERVVALVRAGVACFHLCADFHGRERGAPGLRFVTDLLRGVHRRILEERIRDRVTLLASGGIVAAEHVPKAILCGADLVALDTAALMALEVEWEGEWTGAESTELALGELEPAWAVQRLENLLAAWRDQLLEILGAMGLRDVRRLRGEVGRAMFADELEQEVFGPLFGKRRSTTRA